MEHALYDEMFSQETRHWWFIARRNIILSLLKRYLSKTTNDICECKVLDVGSGCGANLASISRLCNATGIEPSFEGLSYCRKRRLHVTKGSLPDNLPVPENFFDAVLLIDVLEHIDNDCASVAKIHTLLKFNGILLVTVPAYQWLYTARDAMHHHKRRYSKKQLHDLIVSQGFAKDIESYYNFWLFPLACVQRLSRKVLGMDEQKTDLVVPPAPINNLMKKIFQSERFLLPYLTLPFGLSLIGVYRKKGGHNY